MSDAFAGLKLSETAKAGSVDQRLFGSTPASGTKVTHWRERVQEESGPVVKEMTGKGAESAAGQQEPMTTKLAVPATRKEGSKERGKPELTIATARVESPLLDPASKAIAPFDINARPWRKDSFLFTDTEFDRLDDLKLEIRRRFDLPATKNDIARAALQGLFEDYAHNPEKSRVIHYLRTKNR